MSRNNHVSVSRRGKRSTVRKFARAADDDLPHWDRSLHTLFFHGCVVKHFRYPAPDLELLLAAFEELGWPEWIDDPLPPKAGRDPKQRLHDVIQNFNRRLDCPLLKLRGNGSGTGVGWERCI